MIKPISPQEVQKALPDVLIEVVNELINENYRRTGFNIKKKDIVVRVTNRLDEGISFNYKWLDFEDVYREQGWSVSYDGPAFNETYDAFYTFSKKSS